MHQTISSREVERQYRVLQQTLGMHSMLRDDFMRKARMLEIILLLCSVIFCATVFSADQLFLRLHLPPETSRVVLGIASVLAFASSLILTTLDWREKSIQHSEAAARWSSVLEEFRTNRTENGEWPESTRSTLSVLYWQASRNTVKIPDARFNRLKTRYLRKVELSTLKSAYPGCPRICLWVIFVTRDSYQAIRALFKFNTSTPTE